jgi:hypothetical protein
VDVFIRKVRQKLEKASPDWSYIHTHFGVGYRFDPEPRKGPAPEDRLAVGAPEGELAEGLPEASATARPAAEGLDVGGSGQVGLGEPGGAVDGSDATLLTG